jgi:hypothetical protein
MRQLSPEYRDYGHCTWAAAFGKEAVIVRRETRIAKPMRKRRARHIVEISAKSGSKTPICPNSTP